MPIRRLALAALLLALGLAAAAAATPPQSVVAGQSGGLATASWTLPAGEQSVLAQVSPSNAVGADGGFTGEIVDVSGPLDPSATSWTGSIQLDPGTYYLQVQSYGSVYEWSAPAKFTVPAGASTSTTTTTTATTTSATTTSTPAATSTGATTTSTAATTTAASTTTAAATTTTTAPPPTTTAAPPPPPPPTTTAAANRPPAVASLRLARAGSLVRAQLRACDDAPGPLTVRVTARRGAHGRSTLATVAVRSAGCATHALRFRLPPGSGRATVTVVVGDAAGAWSGAVVRRI